jgi:group II intron reverse transcriptase/maturase
VKSEESPETPWESDQPIVPEKPGNAGGGKGLTAEPEALGKHSPHTEAGKRMETKLRIITEKARENPKLRFTSLAHHLNEEILEGCYEELRRKKASGGKPKAPGVDGVEIEEYGKDLKENLKNLVARMKAKAYRPMPVRRVYIPKPDGGQRPLGIPAVEDKIVQLGIAKILSATFEPMFQETSYGFRPGRNAHQALARLDQAVMTKPVHYVVDMDIEKFFDSIPQDWLVKCLEVRIADPSLIRLVVRFLKSGVMEEGKWRETELGAPQGGNLSPILSNIFLHYILDLWFEKKVRPCLKGYADYCRFADDFVVCFERREEAETFGQQLKERLAKFGLKISEKKSRIIEFGRQAWEKAKREGGRVATFDFLGFTHHCATTQKGRFKLGRKTASKKLRAKLTAMNEWLKSVRNAGPLKAWWPVLRAKLQGHYNYYGVSGNMRALKAFEWMAVKWAFKWINRRSQKRSYNWEQFKRFQQWNPLPRPRIYHWLYAYGRS